MSTSLQTERLVLRPFEKADAEAFYTMNLDEEVLRYTGDKAFESVREAEDYIANYTDDPEGQVRKYGMGRMAVLDIGTQKFLGFCGIKIQESSQIVDIGYRFLRGYWGKGYATEACQEVLKMAFENHKLPQVIAHVHEQNTGSQRVVEKLGFQLDHRFLWDGLLPGRYYKLTKDDYSTRNRV